jgi:hypothetical protein
MEPFGGDEDRGRAQVPGGESDPIELWITAGLDDHPAGPTGPADRRDREWTGPRAGSHAGRTRWIALAAGFVVLIAVVAVQHFATARPSASTTGPTSSPAPTAPSPSLASSSFDGSGNASAGPAASEPGSGGDLVGLPAESAGAVLSSRGDEAASAFGWETPAPDATSPATLTAGVLGPPNAGNWELVGYGYQGLVRYRPSTGRIVVTPMADITDNGPPTLVVTASSAFIGSPGNSARYLVRDGRSAAVITDVNGQTQSLLPGPDANHVWDVVSDGTSGALVLLDSIGNPTGTRIAIPAGLGATAWYRVTLDGAGYALTVGVGGTYDVRPDGVTLVTHGEVLAAGPTALLVYECDDQATCSTAVVDRRTGTRRPGPSIDPSSVGLFVQGVISPDGRFAALLGIYGVTLFDLDSGTERNVAQLQGYSIGNDASTMFAFSPDGRYLLIASQLGEVIPVETATGIALDPLPVPPMTVIAVRPGG